MYLIYLDHIQPKSSLPLLQPDSPNLPLCALSCLKQLPHAHICDCTPEQRKLIGSRSPDICHDVCLFFRQGHAM